jgi:hypothetical protein
MTETIIGKRIKGQVSITAVRLTKQVGKALVWTLLLLGIAWGALVLWFDGPSARWLAVILSVGFAAGSLILLAVLRPFSRGVLIVLAAFLVLVTWWSLIPPRNDRDWYPDVARLSHATIEGSRLTIENVRNFDYRTETNYTPRWETRAYDLDRLRGVDLFLSFWGPTLVAHTITSWEFDNGQHLAISIETRKEKGESYSAVRGFFRQYEVFYVVADERDLVRLRTNYRGERVYLYRIRMRPEQARALLLDFMKDVNRLAEKPLWYNALTYNCTTAIRYHAKHVAEGRPLDWRVLANGRLDELGYEQGRIDTSVPFPELKKRSDITEKAKAANDAPDFSARIRAGLPGQDRKSPAH